MFILIKVDLDPEIIFCPSVTKHLLCKGQHQWGMLLTMPKIRSCCKQKARSISEARG